MRQVLRELLWRDEQEREALLWAAGLGAFGVASGYAVFAVVRGAAGHGGTFVAALVVAAFVSFGGECIRELVKRGHVFEDAPEPVVVRAISTFLVVFVIEMFVHAWHEGAETLRPLLSGLADLVLFELPKDLSEETRGMLPNLALILVSFVWIALGALLSWLLVLAIFREAPGKVSASGAPTEARRVEFWGLSAVVGAAVGLLVPIVLLGLVLVIRFAGALWAILVDHEAWRANLRTIAESGPVLAVLTAPIVAVDELLAQGSWVRGIFFVLLGSNVVAWLWKRGPALVFAAVVWVVFLPALAYDVSTLLRLLGASILLWLIPGVALGVALPFLREPQPRHWGVIAAGSGLVLFALAFSQAGGQSEYVAAALAFGLAVILVFVPMRPELTLLLALVSGLVIYAAALIPATVLGVASDFAVLSTRPALGAPALTWAEARALESAGEIDARIREFPELHRALPGRLEEAHAQIRDLGKLEYQARRQEVGRLTMELRTWLREKGDLPFRAAGEVAMRAEGAWQARQRWLQSAIGSLEKTGARLSAQHEAERIRARQKSVPTDLPGKLNASLGGAIGYTVTLALLAAWRIKDRDDKAHEAS